MAYTIQNPAIGNILPIGSTDAGTTFTNGSTVYPTPPLTLGMIVTAFDPTYGFGEFILLPGASSTVVGSLVSYNTTSYTTTLAPITGTNLSGPVAVAMAANTSTSTWGWYQIAGAAVIKKPAVKAQPASAIYVSTSAGRVRTSAYSGRQVLGARTANSTTVTTTTSTVTVILNRPHLQGQAV